jgi:hypothetical protein
VPAPIIAAQLAQRCEDLVRELFPDARPHGAELRWHGRGGAVHSMALRGGKRGVWANWGDDREKGDALELVHFSLFPDEVGRRESIRWGARWLGIDVMLADDPGRVEQLQRLTVEALERQAQHADEVRAGKQKSAKALFLEGSGSGSTSPEIISYLRGRGIDVADLAGELNALRFMPDVYFEDGELLPAMLAAVISAEKFQQIGTQITFLRPCDDGVWRKAAVDPVKKTRGMFTGGVVPLLRGRSGKPLHEAPEGDTILIAEGIENALAASLAAAELIKVAPRVVACLGVANLPELTLPRGITTVFLAFDRDGENETVRRTRDRAVKRFKSEGRDVDWLKTPPGVKDFADYVAHEFWGAV